MSRRLLHFLTLALTFPSMFPSLNSGKDRNKESGGEGLTGNPHSPKTTPLGDPQITGSSFTGWTRYGQLRPVVCHLSPLPLRSCMFQKRKVHSVSFNGRLVAYR
ncbi:hypothetical protein PIB30_080651 [Stylosanthes scabra]|uniref:Secreted protein n=1 Tax=Stylosanthes scabra TaxID=79078 RepID=A0ABU6UU49_9FABA|nr:hypothetical protein [Stylosanthes scabra]